MITSANLRQGGYVFADVNQFGCWQNNSKSYQRILMKFSENDDGKDDYILVMSRITVISRVQQK